MLNVIDYIILEHFDLNTSARIEKLKSSNRWKYGNHEHPSVDAPHRAKRRAGSVTSKLKKNSKLYLPYEGAYSGKGAHKKYGEQINYKNIPTKFLKKSTCEKSIQTDIYQMTMLHKLFSKQLNVVIIVKENLKTKARDFVILFSSDLDLDYEKLIDYYKLRFQIEFNFRDAKQYWGLEDFMT